MEVRLPIYQVADSSIIGRFTRVNVLADVDTPLVLPVNITSGESYEVTIEYYTDINFSISLVIGSSVIPLADSSSTHKMVSTSFTTEATTKNVALRLIYDRQGATSAFVSYLQFRKRTSSSTGIRYVAEKWEFHDTYMGERYITLNASLHTPIDWHIGDYLTYRGQTYYLNNVPTATQNARAGETGDAFVYENVRFDDDQGKMYDCMLLDITPTTGDYIASRGTNYTGSSTFTIYCAETTVSMRDREGVWHDVTLSPVAYLGGVIQANLNRLYPKDGWRVDVNPDLTGLDDKVVSVNKWYVPQALAEIHNLWDVDYICIGRVIKIGYTLNNITGDDSASYMFGYGEGYAQRGDDGKSLFRIKRTANSSQKIITRLRAMGSTRNMPYRYYHKHYDLPQAMYVQNLQLPDTFETPAAKQSGNASRDAAYGYDEDGRPILRHVLGDSNDAYIDKLDDAASCPEGIREGAAFWDGSDSDLEEIYPTIKSGTYRDLRAADIPDMDGRVPSQQASPTNAYPNYDNDERIDEILGVDSRANIGDGVMAENDAKNQFQVVKHVEVGQKSLAWSKDYSGAFKQNGANAIVKDAYIDTLFTVPGVSQGKYQVEPSTQSVKAFLRYAGTGTAKVRFRFMVYATYETGNTSEIAEHISPTVELTSGASDYVTIELPSIPNTDPQTQGDGDKKLELVLPADINVKFAIELVDCQNVANGTIIYRVGSDISDVKPEYIWEPQDVADTFMNTPFSIYVKDIGIDLSNISTTGEDAVIHFNTGACGGMDFKWNPNTATPITLGTKKGWKIDIVERFTDDTIHAYYPSQSSPITPGDQYVLLNIEFPETYIKIAEIRLLQAATAYLADNCEPKYTYEPEISDIYLQNNIDICESQGNPDGSIYWNLYAGFKFSMRGIPDREDQVLPVIDNVTIKSVTIREGEQDTPKVEIVLNDDVEQSTLQKLTVTVDRIYNGIFGGGGGSGSSVSYGTLISLLNSEGKRLFLSKQNNDTAKGKITFQQGFDSQAASTTRGLSNHGDITNEGTLTQKGNVVVGDVDAPAGEASPTVRSAHFTSGMTGWFLDNFGNMEVESLTVRSVLEVTELLINRLQAQEGDTIFTDNDQITDIQEETDETDGSVSYILTLKEKWEGYFTAQQVGNVVKGIINTLAAKQSGVSDYSETDTDKQGSDAGGNLYYTSWMRVVEDRNTEGSTLGGNQIRVVLYGDSDTPAQRNFPPCVNMTIGRWGCALSPDEPGISTAEKQSREKRQRLFFISASDGRIMKLRGVNKPILEQWNYGMTFGTIPEFMWQWRQVAENALPNRDYLYAQGLIYQSLIKVNPQGEPIAHFVDCGTWVDGGADGMTPTPGHGIYLCNEYNPESGDWETHDVWAYGCKWRCLQHQPVTSGGVATYYPPEWNSAYWQMIEGNENFSMELLSSNGNSFRIGFVDTEITPYVYYGNMDITLRLDASSFYWTRKTMSTDGQSEADLAWNATHRTKVLHLTNADMPIAWSRENKAVFTCSVVVNDGKNDIIIDNQVIV